MNEDLDAGDRYKECQILARFQYDFGGLVWKKTYGSITLAMDAVRRMDGRTMKTMRESGCTKQKQRAQVMSGKTAVCSPALAWAEAHSHATQLQRQNEAAVKPALSAIESWDTSRKHRRSVKLHFLVVTSCQHGEERVESRRVLDHKVDLPWHVALKEGSTSDSFGREVSRPEEEPNLRQGAIRTTQRRKATEAHLASQF